MPRRIDPVHFRKCFTSHLCPWIIEPGYGWRMLAQARAMPWSFKAMEDDGDDDETPEVRENRLMASTMQMVGSVALISIDGPMQKFDSSLGGCNTIRIRQCIRSAMSNPTVGSILLRADTPGGTVAGTGDLAADVKMADAVKPVIGYAEDMTCSAGYWTLSQTRKMYANATALIGCIGTVMSVEDSSKKAEMDGIKVHVISTGEFKGAFTDGTPVTPDQLAYLQALIDGLNSSFLAGVREGRKMDAKQLKAVSDGRCFLASEGKSLGLIDGIQSLDETLAWMQTKFPPRGARRRDQTALAIEVASAE